MDIHIDFYEEPEWMRWENMPEYDAPVPKECIEDKMWKVRKVCGFCGEPIKDRSTYCSLHAKHFREPKPKIVRR
jgi:hypothetical protein